MEVSWSSGVKIKFSKTADLLNWLIVELRVVLLFLYVVFLELAKATEISKLPRGYIDYFKDVQYS